MKALLRGAWLVAAKDLRIELRTKEVTMTTSFFAVIVVLLSSLAFYLDRNVAAQVAPGVLWVSVAFAGLTSVLRSWGREREEDALRGLLLSPIPRASIFFGKLLGNLLFLFAVEIVVVALVALFFHLEPEPLLPTIALLLLGSFGFVAAGTLFGALSVQSRARDLVMSIVVFPLVTPALLGGVVATRELFAGATLPEVVAWIQILGAFDLVFVGAGYLLFDALLSD
ncbi:MAG: heme exporter protein CcmB [Myxococcales bacterium]|nr:heme exporter protein CcmB [Myxococcales bacterium]